MRNRLEINLLRPPQPHPPTAPLTSVRRGWRGGCGRWPQRSWRRPRKVSFSPQPPDHGRDSCHKDNGCAPGTRRKAHELHLPGFYYPPPRAPSRSRPGPNQEPRGWRVAGGGGGGGGGRTFICEPLIYGNASSLLSLLFPLALSPPGVPEFSAEVWTFPAARRQHSSRRLYFAAVPPPEEPGRAPGPGWTCLLPTPKKQPGVPRTVASARRPGGGSRESAAGPPRRCPREAPRGGPCYQHPKAPGGGRAGQGCSPLTIWGWGAPQNASGETPPPGCGLP